VESRPGTARLSFLGCSLPALLGSGIGLGEQTLLGVWGQRSTIVRSCRWEARGFLSLGSCGSSTTQSNLTSDKVMCMK
jgi:hypothetical protein